MGVRAKVPMSLSGVLIVAVAALGGLQVWTSTGATAAIEATAVLAYLAWLMVETRLVSLREATLPDAPRDKGSCEAYAVAQGATVLLALILASRTSLGVAVVGLVLLLIGLTVRLSAVVTLGRFYSRRVRLLDGHEVITHGPYRIVRHPAYLGTLTGHLGFVLVFLHWAPLLAWAALFVPLVVRRILLEEPVLFELGGYADYASRRKRLLPLVW
jgi:protein-S-isoprenylcysteine O-methyltransferase Ste14